MEKRIKVTIEDMKWIPSIGKGPVRNPISITHDQYNLLKLLGFNVIPYEEKIKVQPIELPKKNKLEIPEVEEEIVEEVQEESQEVEEEIVGEEIPEMEEVAEEVQEIEEVIEEVKETLDVNSMTKKQLKAELDSRNISYAYNATAEQLKKLLSENL